MVATETNPRRPVAGITFPHKRCRWRVKEDARSRHSHSLDVVDVVVHLTITRSCTRRHNRQRPRARSHVQLVVDSSTPSVQRGSGRRDPRRIWGSNFAGEGKDQASMNMEERGAFYRRGWAAPRGWPAKERLSSSFWSSSLW
jgi:hypothetical protein